MVLVSQRRAEQRHDPVTHHLVHRTLVAVNSLHHQFEHGVQDLAGFLGIPVSEKFHRALEVSEQHRDLLALAFKGALRGEDFLYEVLRRVQLRRREPRCSRCWRGSRRQCCATAIAELAPGLDLRTAARATRRKCPAALATETGTVAVICLAAEILHARASEYSGWRKSER
jgi:hypothetical protein